MKIGFISLGCSKNLVVTEEMIGMFKEKGFEIVNDPSISEIILINTCGFIEPAKQESIDTILEMAEYKAQNCKYLIVCGCLVERYKEELKKLMPEVDLFISIKDYKEIWEQVSRLINTSDNSHYDLDFNKRYITTGENYAYLKIAEGCSNGCTYCAIPKIQGPYASRTMDEIIAEAEHLAEQGIQELILIAQDTGRYGTDIYGEPMLPTLLRKLCKIDGIRWIRFLYTYPETITDELIDTVASEPKLCTYFDIPIQHASDAILSRMNRRTNKQDIMQKIEKLRERIPGVIIRTTLIVGFPGETDEDFNELKDFVSWAKFDKLGVFEFSEEEGTAAALMDGKVPQKVMSKRKAEIMNMQKEISKNNLEKNLDKEFEAIIDGMSDDGAYYIGRTYMDVPEEDGVLYIKNTGPINDKFVKCKITQIRNYDMIGEVKI